MGFLLLLWLCVSAVFDARYRKSFNWVALSGLVVALISVTFNPGSHPVKLNIYSQLLGMFFCFFVFLFFYRLKLMGAGDVKFAAALGAWVGWELLLPIWALSCGFAVLHGVVVRSNLKYFFSASINWKDGGQEKKEALHSLCHLPFNGDSDCFNAK